MQIPTVLLQSDYFITVFNYLALAPTNYIAMNLIDTANPWDSFFSGFGWIILSVIGDFLSAYTVYLAIVKLRIFVTEIDKGFKATLSQVVLTLEIIGNTLRFFFFIGEF